MKRQSKAKKAPPIKHTLRLYPGDDDDLIDGLDWLADQPGKTINQVLKDALRQLIVTQSEHSRIEQPDTHNEIVITLAEIRQVVTAAITEGLASFSGQLNGAKPESDPNDETQEDEETMMLLDSLGAALVLEVDDD